MLVTGPQVNQSYLSGVIRDRQDHILQLLDMHCGSDQSSGAGSGSKDGSKVRRVSDGLTHTQCRLLTRPELMIEF